MTTTPNTNYITVTPTLTNAGAYAIGDYVGTSGVPISFDASTFQAERTSTIISAVLVDYALQSASLELWLFDGTVTPPADNAAWSISDADAKKCLGVIPFSTYYASALNSVSPASAVGISIQTLAASRTIYGCLVSRGAPTYASGDLTIRLAVWQD